MPRQLRAFTLIEVVIAIIIIAVMAAMIMPRLTRTVKGEHEAVVDRMQDLLSMYAFREGTSSQQIAIWQDPETGWFTLLTAQREQDGAHDGRPAVVEWVADRRLTPIALPRGMELAELLVDGQSVTGTDWLIPTVPGGGRPAIEMRLVSDAVDSLLRLDSNAIVPVRMDSGAEAPFQREARDMTEYGSRGEQW